MEIQVIKIGGNVIDNPEALQSFLSDFARLKGPKILVHGGGKEASRQSKSMGMEPKMIDGRRVTDRATLDIVTMVYAGAINKRIVAALQSFGCQAVGLTGADGPSITAVRRAPNPVDYGYVGDIAPDGVDYQFIGSLLKENRVPVFCAICYDGNGGLLNCNADSVAGAVAVGVSRLGRTRLTFCFEQAGVLSDINDTASVIPFITPANFEELKAQGIISGGMLPKLTNALECAASGVESVRITLASALHDNSGTVISTR